MALERTLELRLEPLADCPSGWWLGSLAELGGVAGRPAAARWMDRALESFETGRHASELTATIASRVSGFLVSFGLPQHSVSLAQDSATLGSEPLELCFVPRESAGACESPASYDRRRQAICLYALDWPVMLLAGVLFHELVHAYPDRALAWSCAAAADEADFAPEHLLAHQAETDVFDHLTRGAYGRALEGVLLGHRVWSWETLLPELGPADFQALDEALGCDGSGLEILQLSVVHHSLALGCRLLDRTRDKDEVEFQKARMYLELTRIFGRGSR